MTLISPIPRSQAFDALSNGAQFRDLIAIRVSASPDAVFNALEEVALPEMKVAWLLGELRYLPLRLAGRMPRASPSTPFLAVLRAGGTLVLRHEADELILGSAGRLHRLDQQPKHFTTRAAFDMFDDPGYEKLYMSVRVCPTGLESEQWLVLEHATRALSGDAEVRFRRYWTLIKPLGAFVSRALLRAVRDRAERKGVGRSTGPEPKSVATPSTGAGPRVLVVYGTTEGHTAKVAAAVAETLQGRGLVVEVAEARRAPAPDGFDGVVVAASVHGGAYQRPVRRWVRAHASALNEKPTAFLSVCLAVLQRGPAVQREVTAIAERLFSATGWYPTMSAPVAGALPYSRYGWLKRRVMLRIVAGAGGDTDTSRDYEYTDWAELRSFTTRFARRVRERAPGETVVSGPHDMVA